MAPLLGSNTPPLPSSACVRIFERALGRHLTDNSSLIRRSFGLFSRSPKNNRELKRSTRSSSKVCHEHEVTSLRSLNAIPSSYRCRLQPELGRLARRRGVRIFVGMRRSHTLYSGAALEEQRAEARLRRYS